MERRSETRIMTTSQRTNLPASLAVVGEKFVTTPIRSGIAKVDSAQDVRPCVRGKFIFVGDEKFYVRGVTYGTFRPDPAGHEFPTPEVVERDFSLMAANGINAVRTYTAPPLWLLDTAK